MTPHYWAAFITGFGVAALLIVLAVLWWGGGPREMD